MRLGNPPRARERDPGSRSQRCFRSVARRIRGQRHADAIAFRGGLDGKRYRAGNLAEERKQSLNQDLAAVWIELHGGADRRPDPATGPLLVRKAAR